MSAFVRLLPDWIILRCYRRAGALFGGDVSYGYMGKCIDFDKHEAAWGRWERDVARRGYRTTPFLQFVDFGGYGRPLAEFGAKRTAGEPAVLHSERFAASGFVAGTAAQDVMDGGIARGVVYLPDTETQ